MVAAFCVNVLSGNSLHCCYINEDRPTPEELQVGVLLSPFDNSGLMGE